MGTQSLLIYTEEKHIQHYIKKFVAEIDLTMIQARLLIILSLAIFVTAMPNNINEESELEVSDRGRNKVCSWAGTAPACRTSWNGKKCRDSLQSISTGWFVEKTSKKGDGRRCWTGKKAYCCRYW